MTGIARRARQGGALLRQAGPAWVAGRAWYELRRRTGALERRTPLGSWSSMQLDHAAPGFTPDRLVEALRGDGAPPFFVGTSHRARYRELLLSFVPERDLKLLVDEVESLQRGEYPFFSGDRRDIGWPPAWHRHPLTGEAWPLLHWSRLPASGGADVKWVWEAGRFGVAYTIVRACWITGDDRYAETFWQLVEAWRGQNPPNHGVHWMCGQECAFRALAWSFALFALLDSPRTTPARVVMLAEMLAAHAERIAGNHAYAIAQKNNHGVIEALGLWTIATVLPMLRRAPAWEATGRATLEREARRQIYDDGAYVQHSMNYHRLMLQAYAWALQLGERAGRPFSAELRDRYRAATRLLHGLVDEASGKAPNYGANDGALLFRLDGCDFRDYRPALALAFWIGERRRLFSAGPWDETLLWLSGEDALDAPVVPLTRADVAAPIGGYYTVRGDETWAFVRSCAYRDRPGQADLLHIDLWWKGENIVADPGTFAYAGPAPWDNGLAGTDAHNAVCIDGLDQMTRGPRFLWFGWPAGRVLRTGTVDAGIRVLEAQHDGFVDRLRVLHRRAVLLLDDRLWLVVDDVLGSGERTISSHWLFPWAAEEARAGAAVRLATPTGQCAVQAITVRGDGTVHRPPLEVIVSSPDTTRGWCAFRYGQREPALSVVVTERGELPARRVTLFGLGVDVHVHEITATAMVVSCGDGTYEATWRAMPYQVDESLLVSVRRPGGTHYPPARDRKQ